MRQSRRRDGQGTHPSGMTAASLLRSTRGSMEGAASSDAGASGCHAGHSGGYAPVRSTSISSPDASGLLRKPRWKQWDAKTCCQNTCG